MNMFNEGDLAFLDYGEAPPCIHTRLVGAHLTGNLYMIITPDLDIYEEELSDQNPDLAAFFPGLGGLGSPLPPGVNRLHVYSFRPMSAQQYQTMLQRARTAAAAFRVQQGIPPPGLPVQPPPQAGAAAPGAGGLHFGWHWNRTWGVLLAKWL